MIIIVIASFVFFAGCVGKERVTPTATPSPTSTSEQVVLTPTPTSTPTPTPTATPTPKKTVNVTLKAGYALYQNDTFGYAFAYPENWTKPNDFGLSENQVSGVGFSTFNEPYGSYSQGSSISGIMVVVYSGEPKTWWNEMYGGIDNAKKQGAVLSYGNVTINGREGFEVIGNIFGSKGRWIIFNVNGLYYVINTYTTEEWYSKRKATFDDVVNSFVIEK